MRDILITIDGQPPIQKPAGTRVRELLPAKLPNGLDVIAARVNNDVVSLSYPLTVASAVAPLTMPQIVPV